MRLIDRRARGSFVIAWQTWVAFGTVPFIGPITKLVTTVVMANVDRYLSGLHQLSHCL